MSTLATITREKKEGERLAVYPDGSSSNNLNATGCIVTVTTDVTKVEAEHEVARKFIWREQDRLRHDFDATHTPLLLRCPHLDCDAIFVERDQCMRHGADAHSLGNPEIWAPATVLSDALGITMFAGYVHDKDTAGEAGNERKNADNLLNVLRAILEWRTVPTSADHYEEMVQSALDKSEPWVNSRRRADHFHVAVRASEEHADGMPIEIL